MQPFTFEPAATRVLFGAGHFSETGAEIGRLGSAAFFLLTASQRQVFETEARRLGVLAAAEPFVARMHVPVETVDAAACALAASKADVLVSLGGGSATGLAKALALRTGFPIIAIPTTYSGSEATPIWGLTEGGVKRTGRDTRVLANTIIFDPQLSQSLPLRTSAASGLNAIAHSVEALYSTTANPLTSLKAAEGIRALSTSLSALMRDPFDLAARGEALFGSWLCGMALAEVGMALHHKLCHALGGALDLPHAETHAILIGHSLAYNRAAAPEADAIVADCLGTSRGAEGLFALLATLGLPTRLDEIGMTEADIPRIVSLVTASPYANPAVIEGPAIANLLSNALRGRAPQDLEQLK